MRLLEILEEGWPGVTVGVTYSKNSSQTISKRDSQAKIHTEIEDQRQVSTVVGECEYQCYGKVERQGFILVYGNPGNVNDLGNTFLLKDYH